MVEMTSPATPGPTTRAPLTSTEFSAIALPIRSRPTRLFMNACRLGVSITSTTPATRISALNDQMSMTCAVVSTPSTAATTSWTVAASRSSSRLSCRSATSPPQAPSTSSGAYRAAVTIPSTVPLSVSWSTSQPTATFCIQLPATETVSPVM